MKLKAFCLSVVPGLPIILLSVPFLFSQQIDPGLYAVSNDEYLFAKMCITGIAGTLMGVFVWYLGYGDKINKLKKETKI